MPTGRDWSDSPFLGDKDLLFRFDKPEELVIFGSVVWQENDVAKCRPVARIFERGVLFLGRGGGGGGGINLILINYS